MDILDYPMRIINQLLFGLKTGSVNSVIYGLIGIVILVWLLKWLFEKGHRILLKIQYNHIYYVLGALVLILILYNSGIINNIIH